MRLYSRFTGLGRGTDVGAGVPARAGFGRKILKQSVKLRDCAFGPRYANLCTWRVKAKNQSPSQIAGPSTPQPVTSNTYLSVDRADLFTGNSIVAPDKQLAFRFHFRANDDRHARDVHIVSVCSVTVTIPNDDMEKEMVGHVLYDVSADIEKQIPLNGTDVGPGSEANRDVICARLAPASARNLIKGTARIYVFFWAGWIGEDGIKGEVPYCLWLTRLKPVITAADIKDWQQCSIPKHRLR